jgi:biotin--protein ligase
VDGRTLPFLQYVVTLAVVEAVQEAARSALRGAGVAESALALPDDAAAASPAPVGAARRCVDVRIKWPNDVYGGGVKLGGVLCGSTHGGGAFRVTVGAGLNVSNAQPTSCLDALIAAAAIARGAPRMPQPLCSAALLARILSAYEALEARFVAGGFAPLQGAYLHHWLHTGQRVSLQEAGPPARDVALTVRGLTPGGYLLAQDDAGEKFELCSDGNSLDFFQGLVRKKLAR